MNRIKRPHSLFFEPDPTVLCSPLYANVRDNPGYEPARRSIDMVFEHFPNPDGSFVDDFKRHGFSGRLWELYLYVALTSKGLDVRKEYSAPDFNVHIRGLEFFVEAVTSNPPSVTELGARKSLIEWARTATAADVARIQRHEMAVRLGSPMFSKIQKRYWDLPHVHRKPLVLAIAPFHDSHVWSFSDAALRQYLYGTITRHLYDCQGNLFTFEEKINSHEMATKSIPSGWFLQPDAKHISAILFSNAGTVSKFNRMGYLIDPTHYRTKGISMIRYGTFYNPDPNSAIPLPFSYVVGDERYPEGWIQGAVVFHNPHAIHALPFGLIADIEVVWENDRITPYHRAGALHPFGSHTLIMQPAAGYKR